MGWEETCDEEEEEEVISFLSPGIKVQYHCVGKLFCYPHVQVTDTWLNLGGIIAKFCRQEPGTHNSYNYDH